MRKNEIEEILEGRGDFIKIDYLTRYLKEMPPIEMRKFAYIKLAEIYLGKKMYDSAASMYRSAAINSVTFREKQKQFLMEAKAEILWGKFDESDRSLKRALGEANSREKKEIYQKIVEFYKEQGEKSENLGKHGQTTKIYEKLIRMKINDSDREEITNKLLNLYEKLGKTKEYAFLKGTKL